MDFEFLICVTHGEVIAARDTLAMVALQGGFGISWLVSLGQLVYLFEILLGAATVAFGAVGILCCLGPNALCPGTALFDEMGDSLSDERQPRVEETSEADSEVTIRLEGRLHWLLRGHRCIVTVHTPLGGAQDAGREVWYARSEKSRR